MSEQSSFVTSFEVTPEDIDELGHVNNVVYLRWVQDLAIMHWRDIAPLDDQESTFWVVVRHEIDYLRPAVSGDSIVGKTWVGEASRLRFDRFSELKRERDGKLLARAKTTWCPMSRASGRPMDVSAEIRQMFSTEGGAAHE